MGKITVIGMMLDLLAPGPAHGIAVLAAIIAGLVRGFSGFGTALIFMPLTAAAISPIFAICTLQIMDTVPSIPLLRRAVGKVDWRQILPLLAAATATIPLGIMALKALDPVILRWCACSAILIIVAVLWSGWRMPRAPRLAETIGVGILSGFLSGSSAMAGPPVIIFYLSGTTTPVQVRANLIVFLAGITLITIVLFVLNRLLTVETALWGVLLMVPYGLGVYCGSLLFGKADEQTFRRVALLVILGSALVGLPVFDTVFR